jgi:starch-binding outer membrane protein, SusD/RagB family
MTRYQHKYISLLLPAFLLMGLYSCDSYLDLAPEDTLIERIVFENPATVEASLGDAYFQFLQAATRNVAYTIGDFTTLNTNYDVFLDIYVSGFIDPSENAIRDMWARHYSAINVANNLIEKIPRLASYDEGLQQRHIAEARFIRALCYFNLLKLYGDGALSGNMNGLGLPLQLMPFEGYDTGDVIPRSSNEDVYEQIVTDLSEAIPILPQTHPTNIATRSRGTKGSAWAMLSRVYLYKGNFVLAAEAAAEVLNLTSVYGLTNSLLQLFPPNDGTSVTTMTNEYVFGFPVSNNVGSYSSGNNNISWSYFYKRTLWVNTDFLELFDEGDLRVAQLTGIGFTGTGSQEIDARTTTFKFNNQNGRDNVPIIRLAEVMLTRAEALARTQGINQESVNLLNQVRSRSVPDAIAFETSSFSTPAELIDRILLERRFELAFEGHHRFDLIRTGRSLRNPDLTENLYALPIPQIEIDISQGIIEQNPGYVQ